MASEAHVALVKKGAVAIARWRREHPWERFDLTDADLTAYFLGWADLREANLLNADLSEASLFEANLTKAHLIGTSLQHADLRGAYLDGANLMSANLTDAELSWASLIDSHLHSVKLRGVNVSQATFGRTALANCDLSMLRGLQTTVHSGPSSIGIDTLATTLKEGGGAFTTSMYAFFEETGVPKTILDYLPSLLEAQPIEFFSCFISFSGNDGMFADRLYRDLRSRGIRCWKYDEDALIGRGVWANIDRAISLHEKTIVVCSRSSLERPGVQREIERALQREDKFKVEQAIKSDPEMDTDVLVPVRLDDYVLKEWEHSRKADVVAKHLGDFRDWDKSERKYRREMERLLIALDPRSKLGLSEGHIKLPRPL